MIQIIDVGLVIYPTENQEPYDFYVGASSPIGSPYNISETLDRAQIFILYEVYFKKNSKDINSKFFKYLNEILFAYKKYGKLRLFYTCMKRCKNTQCNDIYCYVNIIINWITTKNTL